MAEILVTGGAGFIGSHIVDKLIEKGHSVTILDNLSSTKGEIPEYLNPHAKFIWGDINNKKTLDAILTQFEIIFHNAASVGIAQSNYEVEEFVNNNSLGTAKLLQSIIELKIKPKFILSSSNTTYGEGLYNCNNCKTFHPRIREEKDLEKNGIEITCPRCNSKANPIPTPESTKLDSNSIYALSKKNQEEMALMLGKMYNFPVVILKYFNVFGPRQSLSNPYTGVSAIFTSRIKNNNPIIIYEDGNQTRDFVYINDVVNANMLAMENKEANYQIFNVGSGRPITIKHIAEEIYRLFDKEPQIEINGKYRKGDIRHCIADHTKIEKILGWKPKVSFEEGLKNLFEWSRNQEAKDDFTKANRELKEQGLI